MEVVCIWVEHHPLVQVSPMELLLFLEFVFESRNDEGTANFYEVFRQVMVGTKVEFSVEKKKINFCSFSFKKKPTSKISGGPRLK